MAEDNEIPGADIPGENQEGDPAALSLAFDIAEHDPGVAAEAAAYLKTQRRLAALQYKYTADKEHFEVSHLRWRRFTEQMKGLLQIMTAVMGATFAIALGVMIWNASRSNGLVIEPFAVAPELAARGLSGEVVAGQMLDDLTAMQDATDSARPAQSYENNWGSDVKVEIPETSISVSELYRFLRAHLGHDTLITGAVWRTPTGIAVTAREGAERGAIFTGAEGDLDRLMQQAAEHVYSVTQPFRYANYLDRDYAAPDIAARSGQAAAIYRRLIAGESHVEKAWAWYGLGTIEFRVARDYPMAVRYFQNAIAANPDFTLGYTALASRDRDLGRVEESRSAWLQANRLFARNSLPDINPRQLLLRRLQGEAGLAASTGDYGKMLAAAKLGMDAPEYFANLERNAFVVTGLVAFSRLHDGGGLRAWLRDLGMPSDPRNLGFTFQSAFGLQDWAAILQFERTLPEDMRQRLARSDLLNLVAIGIAHLRLGDVAGADRLIAPTPADCYDCLLARAEIAEIRGEYARADWWFARAVSQGPSIPFAHEDWGRALLDRGKPDDAIAQFTIANQKSPHFADPLEGWGEALMAKDQSHLALAKFAAAEKYAPNWGRLHLKWGEALTYAGKPAEARAHFARAATLDLTASEKAELAKAPHG